MRPQAISRTAAVAVLLGCVLFYPCVMIFVGFHRPGLNLSASLDAGLSVASFKSILLGQGQTEVRFRESFTLGLSYALVVGLVGTLSAFFYAMWACGKPKADAMKVSFTLLTLALLPQTYLILPVLLLWPFGIGVVGQASRIVLVELLATLPLAAWLLYLLNEGEQRSFQEQCAVDGLRLRTTFRQALRAFNGQVTAVFLLTSAMAWGNFVVPYSLGSPQTYTPIVQIMTFTSHLGRDWARICAAGSLILVPGFLLAILIFLNGRRFSRRYRHTSGDV